MKKQKPFELLGETIAPGKTARITLEVAKLHTNTPIQIPVIVSHATKVGPTLLLLAGLHGDEINGIEAVRRIVKKGWHKPNHGTVICIPVFNIFGFLNLSREFPDGRDLNRMFPGTKNGSLASQFAYIFMKDIAPLTDVIIDFHTGSSQRNNYPQTRCDFNDEASKALCRVFAAPFTIDSSVIAKSIRSARSEEHTSELQSRPHLVCRLLLEKKKKKQYYLSTAHTSLPSSVRNQPILPRQVDPCDYSKLLPVMYLGFFNCHSTSQFYSLAWYT